MGGVDTLDVVILEDEKFSTSQKALALGVGSRFSTLPRHFRSITRVPASNLLIAKVISHAKRVDVSSSIRAHLELAHTPSQGCFISPTLPSGSLPKVLYKSYQVPILFSTTNPVCDPMGTYFGFSLSVTSSTSQQLYFCIQVIKEQSGPTHKVFLAR